MKMDEIQLIGGSIPFKTGDTIFDSFAEARTDFHGVAVGKRSRHGAPRIFLQKPLKFLHLMPMIARSASACQITARRDAGVWVCGNGTLAVARDGDAIHLPSKARFQAFVAGVLPDRQNLSATEMKTADWTEAIGPLAHMQPRLRHRASGTVLQSFAAIASSARFSSSTFTRGSPSSPSCRCVICSCTSASTLFTGRCRFAATRGT